MNAKTLTTVVVTALTAAGIATALASTGEKDSRGPQLNKAEGDFLVSPANDYSSIY